MARFEHIPIYDTPDVLIKSGQTALIILVFGTLLFWGWEWSRLEWLGWTRPQWVRWTGFSIACVAAIGLISLIPLVRRAGNPWGPPKAPETLLTSGLFAVMHHPGDTCIFLFGIAWGFYMGSWLILVAMVPWAIAVHFLCHRREERFFRSQFHDQYAAYEKRVKRYGIF